MGDHYVLYKGELETTYSDVDEFLHSVAINKIAGYNLIYSIPEKLLLQATGGRESFKRSKFTCKEKRSLVSKINKAINEISDNFKSRQPKH